ncbi:MAG: MarR family transcriptional regulator [Spirochaetales bacterium]|nr:MarR family transcriptional regulator [Spirochaetales bacterium]
METISLGKIIEILTHRIEEYERRIIEKSDLSNLSARQLYYLDEIYHLKQPTLTELAEKIDVSKPSATALVYKLERNGYIKKIRSEEDRRSFNIMLTEKGEKLAVLHDGIHYRFAEIIERFLSDKELLQLTKLLKKVIEKI